MTLKNKNILITCGPTWVPIDDVRVISNHSTGEMGFTIAEKLIAAGANVTLLLGPVTYAVENNKVKRLNFKYFDELYLLLKKELKKKFDIVIHAAAVSDYKLKKKFNKKIDSQSRTLQLQLIKTPKLIDLIKRWSPGTFLVGFKLESTGKKLIEAASSLFNKARCDLVIANYFNHQTYHGFIIDAQKNILAEGKDRAKMAHELIEILKEKI